MLEVSLGPHDGQPWFPGQPGGTRESEQMGVLGPEQEEASQAGRWDELQGGGWEEGVRLDC